MFTETTLTFLRSALIQQIAYAQYIADGETMQTEIKSAAVTDDGRIAVNIAIDTLGNAGKTVTKIMLCSEAGEVLAEKDEKILCDANLGSLYYCFSFRITEEEP